MPKIAYTVEICLLYLQSKINLNNIYIEICSIYFYEIRTINL